MADLIINAANAEITTGSDDLTITAPTTKLSGSLALVGNTITVKKDTTTIPGVNFINIGGPVGDTSYYLHSDQMATPSLLVMYPGDTPGSAGTLTSIAQLDGTYGLRIDSDNQITTFNGTIDLQQNGRVINVDWPVNPNDVAIKAYVDTKSPSGTLTTTDAAQSALLTIQPQTDTSFSGTVSVVGRDPSTNDMLARQITITGYNQGGVSYLTGNVLDVVAASTSGTTYWDIAILTFANDPVIYIAVTGQAGRTINWAASYNGVLH